MLPTNHFLFGMIASGKYDFTLGERILFSLGSMEPDFDRAHRKFPHYREASEERILGIYEQLKETKSGNMFRWGITAHHFADFCCSMHQNRFTEDEKAHWDYEAELRNYLISHLIRFKRMKFDCTVPIEASDRFLDTGVRFDLRTDLEYGLMAVEAAAGAAAEAMGRKRIR